MRTPFYALAVVGMLGVNCSGQPEVINAQSGPYATNTSTSTRTNARQSPVRTGTRTGQRTSNTTSADAGGTTPGTLSNTVKPSGSDDGASADSGESDAAPSTGNVSLSLVKPIIDKHCTSCHNSSGDSPDLSTAAKIKSAGQAVVRSAAGSPASMPLGGSLSDSDKETLRAWKDGGFAE